MLLSIADLSQIFVDARAAKEPRIAEAARQVLATQANLQETIGEAAAALSRYNYSLLQLAQAKPPEAPNDTEQSRQAASGTPDNDGVTPAELKECGCRSLQHDQGCRLHPLNKNATDQAEGKSTGVPANDAAAPITGTA